MFLLLDLSVYLIINPLLFKLIGSGFSDPLLFLVEYGILSDTKIYDSKAFDILDYGISSVSVDPNTEIVVETGRATREAQ